jgi:hypothetical protein
MRSTLLAFVVLGLAAGVVGADENDLSNGVFIAHHAPSLEYTLDPPEGGWGEALQNSADAIDDCEDQLNRLDGPGDHMMWFIICAWTENKVWVTTQVGLQAYDPTVWAFQNNGPVYPGGGEGCEIYTNNFPHGNPIGGPSGMVFGPMGLCWGPTNFEPVWWFEGYAYANSYGSTLLQLDVDPSTEFGGWYNTFVPPDQYAPACFGAMGVNTDGVYCCPAGLEYFACCFPDGSCEVMAPEDCVEAGGLVYEDSDTCDPNPCPPTTTRDASWGSIKAMYR